MPVAVVTYLFLKAVDETQEWVFATLPSELGIDAGSAWWPIVPLTIAGLVVALTIRLLPGEAGHKPAEGFTASGPVQPIELPGIIVAAFVTLGLGVVLGPEAPLIAIGSGLGVLAIRLVKRDAPEVAVAVIAAAGSFAAISTLLGSPLLGAFLLMEAAGLGPMTGAVLVPGLLGAGIGSLRAGPRSIGRDGDARSATGTPVGHAEGSWPARCRPARISRSHRSGWEDREHSTRRGWCSASHAR